MTLHLMEPRCKYTHSKAREKLIPRSDNHFIWTCPICFFQIFNTQNFLKEYMDIVW
jgi:hypothetical protein